MKTSSTSQRLKQLMKDENYRQIDILNKCLPYCKKYNVKLGRNDISQYVNGKVEPGQEKLSILGLALNVSEAWLMGYDVPKMRNKPIITSHQSMDDDTLYALSVLASHSGYKFDIFANQYQIIGKDYVIKLSPQEVADYVKSSIEKIGFVTNAIIQNKLKNNITSIQKDLELATTYEETGDYTTNSNLRAAHNDFADNDEEIEKIRRDFDKF